MKPKMTQEIVNAFLDYHQKRGYKVFKSFPLVSEDPTVMFINATVTPFKKWYTEQSKPEGNFALVQRCFRLGDTSGFRLIETNPFYFTFFQMCGSGIFDIKHHEAVEYLLDLLLSTIGLEKRNLLFVTPDDAKFLAALETNDIDGKNIFVIRENGFFWQEWKFGKLGPVGNGLTVVYSRSKQNASLQSMESDPNQYIDLLNLIYIYGQETEGGRIVPILHPGFDLGMGLERVTSVVQECDGYNIDSIRPLMDVILQFSSAHCLEMEIGTARLLTNHLRSICVLSDEDIVPFNKRHGYTLRKLIRHFLELIWSKAKAIIATEDLVISFVRQLNECGLTLKSPASTICDIIVKESEALQKVIRTAKSLLKQRPGISVEFLRDTHGFPSALLPILKGEFDETNQ